MRIPKAIKKLIEENPKTALALGTCISEMAKIKLGQSKTDNEFIVSANIMAREFYIGKTSECLFAVSSDMFGRDVKTFESPAGSPRGCGLNPRDFINFILTSECSQVIIYHNHPSLSTIASNKDTNIKSVIDSMLTTLSVTAHYAIVTADTITYY